MNIKVNERGYVFDADDEIWLPPINLKQFELFNDFHRYVLVDGPRKSSKTFGIIHKVLRHAFDVPGTFAIVNKTMKNAKSSGIWNLLSDWMLPFWSKGMGKKWEPWMPKLWKSGCPGFEVVEGPKTTGDTKLSFVKIRNRFGTISEIQCHSLEHAQEVEAKFKGPVFSGFWCSEADQYLDEHAFHILCDGLRMPGVSYEQHQIILDMNPPDSGPNNWFHDYWFKYKTNPPVHEEDYDPIFVESLHRIPFAIDDNPQLDPKERREMETRYRKKPALYKRFILGLWEQHLTGGHFSDVWDESVHVQGRIDGPEEERMILAPAPSTTVLLTGWDAGESKNHSFHILDKLIDEVEVTEADGRKRRMAIVSFVALDEFVVINKEMSTREFTVECIKRMKRWADYQMKAHKVQLKWRHWSDTSAFNYNAAADRSHAAIVYEASDGQIVLEGAPKYRNSNRDRVNLIWQMLHENRIHVSAQLLVTRAMFANLRQGKESEYIKEDEHKHPFDSLSYPISAEAPADMLKSGKSAQIPSALGPTIVTL